MPKISISISSDNLSEDFIIWLVSFLFDKDVTFQCEYIDNKWDFKAKTQTAIRNEIDDLCLSYRSDKALRGADIDTLDELCGKTERNLLNLKGFGRKSLNEIKYVLKEKGLGLKTNA